MGNLGLPKEFSELIGLQSNVFYGKAAIGSGYEFIIKHLQNLITQEYGNAEWKKHGLGNVVREIIKNSVIHGNNCKGIIEVGFWMGREGVVFSCRDEGDFFSSSVTKEMVENKKYVPSLERKESCMGLGFQTSIYLADRIEVDISQKAIFTLTLWK